MLTEYCRLQVVAGADVIQIFDSWVGSLGLATIATTPLRLPSVWCVPCRQMGVPVIYFGVETAGLLTEMAATGADVIGLDWRQPLDEGWRAVGHGHAVQGNLDPITLFAPLEVLELRVKEILRAAAGRPGHIFNLGHGIVPSTPVENVQAVVTHGPRVQAAGDSTCLNKPFSPRPRHPGDRRADSRVPAQRGQRPSAAAAVVEEIQHRYSLIGRSPLTEITLEQAAWLKRNWPLRGQPVPVYVGMRNWRPYIADVVRQMRADGVEEAAVICLAPQNSRTSVGLYRRAVEPSGRLRIDFTEAGRSIRSLPRPLPSGSARR